MNNVTPADRLRDALTERQAVIGVIGLGYVGLPLAVAVARGGFKAIGFDIDPVKAEQINTGRSYIGGVESADIATFVTAQKLEATADFTRLANCDVIIICVPTPLTRYREPDLSFVEETTRTIAKTLRPGQMVILESTTYPGTTRELLKPILEEGGLVGGVDFFVGFSPEREDPGNQAYNTTTIPKVVAGDGPAALALIDQFYSAVIGTTVPVSSVDTAEAVKITENVFRAVNIALVNELKVIFSAMGIDVWEVIEAAKTKPFGFMPFYPGPGLGGHCIPIDPFYLTWRSRAFEMPTRFIELAGEVNLSMPRYVVDILTEALSERAGLALRDAKVLVVGLSYKKNVPDIRESPSFKLIELLKKRGASVGFHDPYVDVVPITREHAELAGLQSTPLAVETLAAVDVILISTDHDSIDYGLIATEGRLVVDTRNVMARNGFSGAHIVKA